MPDGIIIVGLGPGPLQYWTQAAYKLLHQAQEVYVRYPGLAAGIPAPTRPLLPPPGPTLEQVAAEVVRLGGRRQGVIYAVPGHPAVDEPTVPPVQALAARQNVPVRLIPGLSLLAATLAALGLNRGDRLQVAQADRVAALHHPPFEPDAPALVMHLAGPGQAGRLKRTLLNAYAGSFTVALVAAAGTEQERTWQCPLAELDRQPGLAELTALYLPPDPANSGLTAFQETIAHLRAPNGCPWDRAQTHRSLRPYLMEESYEVLEALDAGDEAALAEELGDLLLQIILHAQIATEADEFRMGQVIGHINRKLWRRHPHVFGDVAVENVQQVRDNWEAIKRAEKGGSGPASVLDGLPQGLPALAEAMVISRRVVQVGFEWPNIDGVLNKLVEEAGEVARAADAVHLEAEIGDLLFSLANLARWRSIDPESALRSTNARFTRRFKRFESLLAGQALSEIAPKEKLALWNQAKQAEAEAEAEN